MHIHKTANILKRLLEVPEPVKDLVQSLENAPRDELIRRLEDFSRSWDRPRGDLCAWIPLLNRFDDILGEMVTKYELASDVIKPMVVEKEDEKTLVSILHFTSFLLDHCSNRSIYNSAGHLNDLLNSTSPFVVGAALKVCGRLAYRFSTLRSGKSSIAPIESEKIFAFATMLPLATDSSDITIPEFISGATAEKIPDSMSDFFLEYFVRSRTIPSTAKAEPRQQQQQHHQHVEAQTPTRQPAKGKTKEVPGSSVLTKEKDESAASEGLTAVHIAAGDVRDLSFETLLGRVFRQIPADVRFKAVHRGWLVTACLGKDPEEELRMRRELVGIVFRAIGYAACSQSDSAVETRIMLKMPELIHELGLLLAPDIVPEPTPEMKLLALETVEFICQQGQRIAEFMVALSGSASHGTLMTLMRNLVKELQADAKHLDEEFTTQLFSVLMIFAGAPGSRTALVTAGLTQLLLDVVQIPSHHVRTLAGAMELLDCLIIGQPASFQIFSEMQGISTLISVIEREASRALEVGPGMAALKLPYLVPLDYTLPYPRAQWIRALFVVISNILLHLRTSESINSMVDSPLLSVSKVIISHPETFGNRIVALNFSILCSMLESESSSFQVMHDTKLVDCLVDAFPKLLELSNNYFPPVCKLINALSSSEGGMVVIQDKGLLKMLISMLSKTWTKNDLLPSLGGVFDSLTADHPSLRVALVSELVNFLKYIPGAISDTLVSQDSFYKESEPNAGLQEVDRYEEPQKAYKVLGYIVGFFEKFLQNHLTRSEFIKQKGYIPLLDLLFIRGLPHDFAFSTLGQSLGKILSLLYQLDIESNKMNKVLLKHIDEYSSKVAEMLDASWAGDLETLDNSSVVFETVAVLNSLLSVFYETVFVDMGTGYRTLACMDLLITDYGAIVGRLFDIQRWCVWQDARVTSGVSSVLKDATRPIDPNTLFVPTYGAPEPPNGSALNTLENQKKAIRAAEAKLGEKEANSLSFKSLKVFRYVCTMLSSAVSKKFSQWAYLCTIERAMTTMRKKGLKMADFIAAGMVGHLEYKPLRELKSLAHRSAKLQALVNLLGILQKVMFKKSPTNVAHLGVFVMFKQRNGIGELLNILAKLWEIEPSEVKEMDQTTQSIYNLAQRSVLVLSNLAATRKSLVESSRSIGPLVSRTADRTDPDYFSPAQFFVECRIFVLFGLLETQVWQSSDRLVHLDSEVCRLFVDILTKLFTAYPEDGSSRTLRDSLPKDLSWEFTTPSEDKVQCLVATGFGEIEARAALETSADNLELAYVALSKSNHADTPLDTSALKPRNVTGVAPISSESGQKLVTISDLNELRSKVKASLLANSLDVIQMQPDTVFNFGSLTMKAYSAVPSTSRSDRTKESLMAIHQDIVITILQVVSSFDGEYIERAGAIAPIVHFLGILMQDEAFFQNSIQELSESIDIFVTMLKLPNAHEQEWYPHVLLIVEKIVTNLDIPESANRQFDMKFPDLYSAIFPRISADVEIELYKAVSTPKPFKNDVSALSITRLCVHFSREHTRATEMLSSGMIAHLLSTPLRFPDSPILVKIQTAVLIVLHQAMETPEMLYQMMKDELKEFLESTKVVDSTTLVKNHSSLIARSPETFITVVSELCTLHDSHFETSNLCLKDYMEKRRVVTLKMLSKEEERVNKKLRQATEHEDNSSEVGVGVESAESREPGSTPSRGGRSELRQETSSTGVLTPDPKVSTPAHSKPAPIATTADPGSVRISLDAPTGVIHLLLNQLFSLNKEGVFTKPVMSDIERMKKLKNTQGEYKAKEHPYYIQCCFLLQALTELLGSYNQSKLEFISYAKKAPGGFAATGAQWRPRSYALNYFIHELIPTGTVSPPANIHACQEWINVSTLASNALINLLSSTQEKGKAAGNKEVQNDAILVFVRKFALDIFSRAFRDIASSSTSLDWRYSVLASLADICWRLLHNRPGMISNGGADGIADGATIAKIMYDKKYAMILTGVLSDLDLNFPDTKKVIRLIIRFINKLSRLSMTQKDLDQVGVNAQDIDYDYDEDSDAYDLDEDQPDIFRNSTLGMFEVDDEDEMYDDEVIDEEMETAEEDIGSEYHYQNVIDEAYSDVDDHESPESEGAYDETVDDSELEDDMDEDEDDMSVQSVDVIVEGDDDEDIDMDMDMESEDEDDLEDDDSDWESYEDDDDIVEEMGQNVGSEHDRHLGDYNSRARGPSVLGDDDDMLLVSGRNMDAQFSPSEEEDEDEDELGDDEMFSSESENYAWELQNDSLSLLRSRPALGSGMSSRVQSDMVTNPLLSSDGLGRGAPRRRRLNISGVTAISQLLHGDGDINEDRRGIHELLTEFSDLFSGVERIDIHTVGEGGQSRHQQIFTATPRSTAPKTHQTPASVVSELQLLSVSGRWQEAALMFNVFTRVEIAGRVLNSIYNNIADHASAESKKNSEFEVQLSKREADVSEKLKQLQKIDSDKAEKKRKEEEAAAAAQREEEERQRREEAAASQEMETGDDTVGMSSEPTERTYVQIGGQQVDITGLGIDPEFMEALPPDLREEAFTQHLRELQTSGGSGTNGAAQRGLDPEFLNALPENIRMELLAQDSGDYGRRLEDSLASTFGGHGTAEMDAASLFASMEPGLRHALLLDQNHADLPPEIAEEARGLRNRSIARFGIRGNLNEYGSGELGRLLAFSESSEEGDNESDEDGHVDDGHHHDQPGRQADKDKPILAAALHLVDKSGVASLIRLLYLPQNDEHTRNLHELLQNLAQNKQTRSEILHLMLHILHDGVHDRRALEKSFTQICARARQSTAFSVGTQTQTPSKLSNSQQAVGKFTPVATPSKAASTGSCGVLSEDVSPMIVTQQMLDALQYLARYGGSVKYYLLCEHDNTRSKSTKIALRGKEKENEKEARYPINLLIELLDQDIFVNNTVTLEILSLLLQDVTKPIPVLLKNRKEKEGKTKGDGKAEENVGASDKDAAFASLGREIPYIPEKNLRKISSILTVRECSSRTFSHTLGLMHNLSHLPSVKEFFGDELLAQAVAVMPDIIRDLKELIDHVCMVEKGTDLETAALAKFSSATSQQAKLLRVLKAIDYLFDPDRLKPKSDDDKESEDYKEQEKKFTEASEYLKSLYKRMTFGPLWSALSDCLRLIQERQDMLHVATALLPLIEALMVVCKHNRVKDVHQRDTYKARKSDIATEQLESLFFHFTDEHRKILNQMVRNNPKLMSGSFEILVKNPKALEFDNKRRYFYRQISHNQHDSTGITLNVRRDQVFLDSFRALYYKSGEEIKTARLQVKFQGEEGVDAGGVSREWFQVLSRQMFNPDYALFTPVAADINTFHPNRTSFVNPEHLMFFKFIGRIIGKAIYDGRLLDCHFSRAVYKKILGKPVSIKDMESLDLDYYKSLLWMLENDITDIITETFSVETEDYGEKKVIDLKPGGRDIPVTEENKQEYVRLVVDYRLIKSVEEQMENFLQGFHDIIPKDVVSIFDEQELELLISGMPDIDIDDWRNNTEYHNYTASSPQVKWFWRAVRSFDQEERAKLLQFTTGTAKVPLDGFEKLRGMNGVAKFSIHRDYGSKERLPSSHTCFNQIDLPEYDSYEQLRGSLLMAITEGREGFGLA